MKTIKFLQESFETRERFQQEISIKYSYNRDTVESINFRINQRNIRYFYEAMQNFENSLVDEFKEKKINFCSADQFLESMNDFDKIIFVIITYMNTYFNLSVLIQGFYNYTHRDLSKLESEILDSETKLESEILNSEIELLQEKLDLMREELCKIMGIDLDLQKKGHEENYIFNLNIDSDNQIGLLLKQLNYN